MKERRLSRSERKDMSSRQASHRADFKHKAAPTPKEGREEGGLFEATSRDGGPRESMVPIGGRKKSRAQRREGKRVNACPQGVGVQEKELHRRHGEGEGTPLI